MHFFADYLLTVMKISLLMPSVVSVAWQVVAVRRETPIVAGLC